MSENARRFECLEKYLNSATLILKRQPNRVGMSFWAFSNIITTYYLLELEAKAEPRASDGRHVLFIV